VKLATKRPQHGYAEAYQQLNLMTADRAWKRGEIACLFRDERGNVLGEAFLIERLSDRVVIGYTIMDSPAEWYRSNSGEFTLHIAHANAERLYVHCPRCQRRVAKIIHVQEWACQSCQKLNFRSQSLTTDIRNQERFEALEAEMAKGRPPRMRLASWRRKLEALQKAREAAPGEWCVADQNHRTVISHSWMTPADIRRIYHPGFEIVNGVLRAKLKRTDSSLDYDPMRID
jgi:hypothetical protein